MVLPMFDEDYLLAKIKKVENSTIDVSNTSDAGLVPVTDGEGGYAWGAVPSDTLTFSDSSSDGNVVISIVEGE